MKKICAILDEWCCNVKQKKKKEIFPLIYQYENVQHQHVGDS